jgi:hypothetical protein
MMRRNVHRLVHDCALTGVSIPSGADEDGYGNDVPMETKRRFPQGLGNLAKNARFPHSHSRSSSFLRKERQRTKTLGATSDQQEDLNDLDLRICLDKWVHFSSKVRPYVPYALLLAAYLAVDLPINSRNYVVAESHYGFGIHVVTNARDYIVALYVGRGNLANYLLIAGGLSGLLLRGSRRVVFATSWLILALSPFVFFTWGNASRYLYLPAMGFSMLMAEGVLQLDRLLASRLPRAPRTALVALIAAVITGRFAWFAAANVKRFADRTEEYRRYMTLFRQAHGDLPSHSRVPSDPRLSVEHPYKFLNALVQWEYRDPTIDLFPDTPNPR